MDAVATDAVHAGGESLAELEITCRALLGRPHGREGQVGAGIDCPEVGRGHAEPELAVMVGGKQEAGAALHRRVGIGEVGQVEYRDGAELQARILVVDGVFVVVVLGLARHDLPHRLAAGRGAGLAGGVARMLVDGDAVDIAAGILGGDRHVVGEQRRHMLGEAFLEGVLQRRRVGLEHVAVGLPEDDRAVGREGLVLHVVDHLGGGQDIGAIGQLHRAGGGGDLGAVVIGQGVGDDVDMGSLRHCAGVGSDEVRLVIDVGVGDANRQRQASSRKHAEETNMQPPHPCIALV